MKIYPILKSSSMANDPLVLLGSIQTRRIKHMKIQQRLAEYQRTHYLEIIQRQCRLIRQLEMEIRCLQRRLKER
jgi:hypothetical protein